MPGQRPLLAMSFVASLGITFEVLACLALPKEERNFWPLLVLIFYILLPLPMMFSMRVMNDTAIGMYDTSGPKVRDICLFITAGIMISSVALPIVIARSPEKPIIKPISCFLVEVGNLLCLSTIGLFCIYFKPMEGF